jgi:hypothetical protein
MNDEASPRRCAMLAESLPSGGTSGRALRDGGRDEDA